MSQAIPSLIKWSGSKRSQAHRIMSLAPAFKRYVEPFVGGGAVLYLAARPGSIASDIYAPLIELWKHVRDDPEALVHDYENQWSMLQLNLPDYYYEVRARFNSQPNALDLNFLARTCVNGIIRFNSRGEFNNSFHLSRPGMHPSRFSKVVGQWRPRVQDVTFISQDFELTLADVRRGDFVYLDPPYSGNNQRYAEDVSAERLFKWLDRLNTLGVSWALSYDGRRGETTYGRGIPMELFRQKLVIPTGNSKLRNVLGGAEESVDESLYLNFVPTKPMFA